MKPAVGVAARLCVAPGELVSDAAPAAIASYCRPWRPMAEPLLPYSALGTVNE